MYKIRQAIVMVLGTLFFIVVGVALAIPGDLDTSFDADGRVTTDFSGYIDEAYDVVIQPDGKMVAAGSALTVGGYDFALARYCPDGSLDNGVNCGGTGFGLGGKMTTDFGIDDNSYGLLLQPDGKIVLVGVSSYIASYADLSIARYCADGTLDDGINCGGTGFGFGGLNIADFGNYDGGIGVAYQPDGKIIAVGYSDDLAGSADFALVRYCADGTLDDGINCGGAGFGTGGQLTTDFGEMEYAWTVLVQPDGKIVAAGTSEDGIGGGMFVLARYCDDGLLDDGTNCGGAGFGAGGLVTTDIGQMGDGINDLLLQPDGKILAVGESYDSSNNATFVLARYCADGSLDDGTNCGSGGFGPSGYITAVLSGADPKGYGVALQADGKIIAVGPIGSSATDFVVARFCSNGAPDDGASCGDSGFGSSGFGWLTTDFNGGYDFAYAVALQSNGRVIVAGSADDGSGSNADFALARYLVNESANQSIAGGGGSATLLGVTITNNSAGACTFFVERAPVPPGGIPGDAGEMPFHWQINTDCALGTYSIDMVFQYTDAELANGIGVVESNLQVFKNSGGATWIGQGGTVDTGANTVTIMGVASLSGWTLGSAAPTAISLKAHLSQSSSLSSVFLLLGVLMGMFTLTWCFHKRVKLRA